MSSVRWWWCALPCWALACERLVGLEGHEFGVPRAGTGGIDAGRSANQGPGDGGGGEDGAAAGKAASGNPGLGNAGRATSSGGKPQLGVAGGDAPAAGDGGASADTRPPTVVRSEPSHLARGVDASSPISIEFSEPMDRGSVEVEYSQAPGGVARTEWSHDDTILTITPDLARPRSFWTDDERLGSDVDLAVTFAIGAGARDRASNVMGAEHRSSYFLARRVDHRLSLCADLSGTASASGFAPLSSHTNSEWCRSGTVPSIAELFAGDRGGEVVLALMSYSLEALPTDARVLSANLGFAFDDPVGEPHQRHGDLLLEQVGFDTDASRAFSVEGVRLGVLAAEGTVYPYRPVKAVTDPVASTHARGATPPVVEFRARFAEAVADDALPDYVRLDGATTDPPTLIVTYDCASCPGP
jgi:hypothetical protein